MNPFCKVAEFPDFPAMTPAAAEEALPKLLADAKSAVDAVKWLRSVRPPPEALRIAFDVDALNLM